MTQADRTTIGWRWLALMTALMIALVRLPMIDKGIELYDEGFLWYGAVAVTRGEVPLRDFMSYDPARYYWIAGWMRLSGDTSLVAMRLAILPLQFIAILLILRMVADALDFTARRRIAGVAMLGVAALSVLLFAYKEYNSIDAMVSVVSLYAVYRLLRDPRAGAWLILGLVVGFAAVWGRNHGVYGLIASALAMGWIGWTDRGSISIVSIARFAGGVVVGFSPVLAMALFMPGFAAAFVESVAALFRIGATNLAVPIPWPWTIDPRGVPGGDLVARYLLSFFFLGLIVFPLAVLGWQGWRVVRGRPWSVPLVACGILEIPYAHHALSRAGDLHVVKGGMPMLVGVLILIAMRPIWQRAVLSLALIAAIFIVMFSNSAGWKCLRSGLCQRVDAGGRTVAVDRWTARLVRFIQKADRHHAGGGRAVLVTPFLPGAYPLLGKTAPNWEIYAIWPATPAREASEIARIAAASPALMILTDIKLDGEDSRHFAATHPMTHRYLMTHYRRLPENYQGMYQLWVPVTPP